MSWMFTALICCLFQQVVRKTVIIRWVTWAQMWQQSTRAVLNFAHYVSCINTDCVDHNKTHVTPWIFKVRSVHLPSTHYSPHTPLRNRILLHLQLLVPRIIITDRCVRWQSTLAVNFLFLRRMSTASISNSTHKDSGLKLIISTF